ncbi:MAG: hypothetical protein HY898_23945 [Deltaproteobacteria bacterium]|nr:hypothetical protein [Deltaproteobacteria bacterium]
MSRPELEPLASDIAQLLDGEKQIVPVASEVQQRVLERVEWTTTVLPPVGAGGDGGAGGPIGAAGGASAASAVGSLFSKQIAIGLATFALGGVVGAGLHATLATRALAPSAPIAASSQPSAPKLSAVESAAPEVAAAPSASAPSARSAPAASEARAAPSASASAEPDAGAPGRDTDLASERALLEIARTAVGRGQAGAALDALARHAQQFPRGRLTEEREVLWIQALASSGRMGEARQRAGQFRRTFPRSMALPAVDAVVGSNP